MCRLKHPSSEAAAKQHYDTGSLAVSSDLFVSLRLRSDMTDEIHWKFKSAPSRAAEFLALRIATIFFSFLFFLTSQQQQTHNYHFDNSAAFVSYLLFVCFCFCHRPLACSHSKTDKGSLMSATILLRDVLMKARQALAGLCKCKLGRAKKKKKIKEQKKKIFHPVSTRGRILDSCLSGSPTQRPNH